MSVGAFTDSHCHLGSSRFKEEEWSELVTRSVESGVNRLVTLATCEEDQATNVAVAEGFSEVFACVGIHPCDVHQTRDEFEEVIGPYLTHQKVAAVGETGLDYFHPAPEGWTEEDYHARQRDFLHRHFELARAAGLNVVIHTRDRKGEASLEDALAIYEKFASEVKAVFHCFPGPAENAERVLASGGYLSYTGVVTFKNAEACREAVRVTPLDRLMVETDSPYLAPEPYRGKRCEPAFVAKTAQRIAEIKGVTLEELALATEKTANEFFRFGL